jgi:hypothetical protein
VAVGALQFELLALAGVVAARADEDTAVGHTGCSLAFTYIKTDSYPARWSNGSRNDSRRPVAGPDGDCTGRKSQLIS